MKLGLGGKAGSVLGWEEGATHSWAIQACSSLSSGSSPGAANKLSPSTSIPYPQPSRTQSKCHAVPQSLSESVMAKGLNGGQEVLCRARAPGKATQQGRPWQSLSGQKCLCGWWAVAPEKLTLSGKIPKKVAFPGPFLSFPCLSPLLPKLDLNVLGTLLSEYHIPRATSAVGPAWEP